MITLPKSIEIIQKILEPNEKYYLVGGAVRDALLNRTNKDLDIVCTGDTKHIARKLADLTSGAFFMLDEERNTCRVITTDPLGEKTIYDFTRQRGGSLEEDLRERDFTINAMAVDLLIPQQIIDPMKGGRDLAEKWLRPCSQSSFKDDPLRVIRAVRYAVALDLRMESSTIQDLKRSIDFLPGISKERKRDELFKIFENQKPFTAIQLLHSLGILPFLGFVDGFEFDRAIQRLHILDPFMNYLVSETGKNEKEYFLLSSFIINVGKNRRNLKDHFTLPNLSDRKMKSLDYLAAMFWNANETIDFTEKMALSKDENEHLNLVIKNKRLIHQIASQVSPVDDRVIHRYFKVMGVSGLDLAVLALADHASVVSAELDHSSWLKELDVCDQMISAWYEKPEVVNPKLLLTGTDLLFEFDLIPGPLFRQLLEGLREEQAAGTIQTRQEAVDWVEKQLSQFKLNSN